MSDDEQNGTQNGAGEEATPSTPEPEPEDAE